MRKLALAAVAFSALALPAPAANASNHIIVRGGCGFNAGTDPSGEIANPNTYTGVIYAAATAASSNPAENPLAITVTCTLKVNSSIVDVEVFAGIGFAVGAGDTSYQRFEGDVVELCTRIQAGDYDTETCGGADHITIPPDEFWQAVDEVFLALDPVFQTLIALEEQFVDPIVCPVFKDLGEAGVGLPGLTQWDPQGDWYVLGTLFWDCPPYNS